MALCDSRTLPTTEVSSQRLRPGCSWRGERSHRRGGRVGEPDPRPPTPAPTRRVRAPLACGVEPRLTMGSSSCWRWARCGDLRRCQLPGPGPADRRPCGDRSAPQVRGERPAVWTRLGVAGKARPFRSEQVQNLLDAPMAVGEARAVQHQQVDEVTLVREHRPGREVPYRWANTPTHMTMRCGFSCCRHARSLRISSNHWNGGTSTCMPGMGLSDRPEVDGPHRGNERPYARALHRMAIHMNSDIKGAYYVARPSTAGLALPLEIAVLNSRRNMPSH